MSGQIQQRLVSEATRYGTAEVLRCMPAEYSPELEQAIRQGVRQGVLYYAAGQGSVRRQPPLLAQTRKAGA